MAIERRADVVWSGNLVKGSGAIALASSGATEELPVTWAARVETPDGKTSPEELIAAAHAACFSMSLSSILTEGGNAPDRLETSAVCGAEMTDQGPRITSMTLEVTGTVPGIEAADFEKAAETAKEGCPVSNALKGNLDIRLKATLA
jgi:lipoyl-dependent peroxiredoxin